LEFLIYRGDVRLSAPQRDAELLADRVARSLVVAVRVGDGVRGHALA
jgi:hypothetical protein